VRRIYFAGSPKVKGPKFEATVLRLNFETRWFELWAQAPASPRVLNAQDIADLVGAHGPLHSGKIIEILKDDLDITMPDGGTGEEDLAWFREHKLAVTTYFLEREWPATEQITGTGPCQADDCKGELAYLAGCGECDRCGISHRIVATGTIRKTHPPVPAIDTSIRHRSQVARR